MKITTTIGSLVATAFLLNMPGGVSAESTSADQLLALAKSAAPIEVRAMQKQVMRLLEEIGVRKEVREGFDEMHFWDVKKNKNAVWSESEDHAIIVSGQSVTLGTAGYAVVIAAGDVTIQKGMGLLVIAGGDIRFEQHPERTEAGVFLTKKSLTADWAADMFVHAHGGARFRSQSVKILAYNTRVVADSPVDVAILSGKPVFSGFPAESAPQAVLPRMVGEIEFVGQRCSNVVPLREIADRVPALALTKAHCKKIDLLVARCGEKSGLAEGEELWTVHMCKNLLTDIRVRTINGRAQIESYNPLAVPRPPRVDTTTTGK